MKLSRIGSALRIFAVATLVFSAFSGLGAQPTSPGPLEPAQVVDRDSAVNAILTAWGDYQIPVDAENNTPYGPFDLRLALKRATPEQLLDAKNAKTFDDVAAALPGHSGGGIVPRALAVGERIPLVLGDVLDDLVYTPVTPCRIMDTRFQTVPARIGPDVGVQRNVVGTTYAAQGGVATSCGIPATGPAAVAINVTVANMSAPGSLRIIQTGGGVPTAVIINYAPSVGNLSNAAVVRAATGAGPNIFVYSATALTDVVIDIMGYFTSPAATPLDITFVESVATSCLNAAVCSATATCPAGFVATGGGWRWDLFSLTGGRDVAATEGGTTSWVVQASNNSGITQGLHAFVKCARVPGH